MRKMGENEVLELLEDGVIYHISDIKWVSHVQLVPEKEGDNIYK